MPNALKTLRLVKNTFPYAIFTERRILSHHLLIPFEHCTSFGEMTDDIKSTYYNFVETLIDSGLYDSALTNSHLSTMRSIPGHLHTHLLKLGETVTYQYYESDQPVNDIRFPSNM